MSTLFQGDIIVIGHPVKTMDAKTHRAQKLREMEADEPCGAGNEDFSDEFDFQSLGFSCGGSS